MSIRRGGTILREGRGKRGGGGRGKHVWYAATEKRKRKGRTLKSAGKRERKRGKKKERTPLLSEGEKEHGPRKIGTVDEETEPISGGGREEGKGSTNLF